MTRGTGEAPANPTGAGLPSPTRATADQPSPTRTAADQPGSARAAAAEVVDPELGVVTIEELGILRDVRIGPDGRVTVEITPTYSGCPAMDVIRADIRSALDRVGYPDAEVVTVLRPAWSTDLISQSGRDKLAASGIAPPARVGSGPVRVGLTMRCPHCGGADTEELSRFGSTACKSIWRCRTCAEPFDHVKAF